MGFTACSAAGRPRDDAFGWIDETRGHHAGVHERLGHQDVFRQDEATQAQARLPEATDSLWQPLLSQAAHDLLPGSGEAAAISTVICVL